MKGGPSTTTRVYMIPKKKSGVAMGARPPQGSIALPERTNQSARTCRFGSLDPVLAAVVCSVQGMKLCSPRGCTRFRPK